PSMDKMVMFNSSSMYPNVLRDFGVEQKYDFEYRQSILSEAQSVYPKDPLRQVLYYDQHTFLCSLLDRNDRMTMGASIECRIPFLDYRLVVGLSSLTNKELFPGNENKSLMRRAIGDRLPKEVLKHKKMGFPVPWSTYILNNPVMKDYIDKLPDSDFLQSSSLDMRKIRSGVDEFLKGNSEHELIIRNLFMLQIWYDVIFNGKADNMKADI
nr:asparagine synthase C-terminal domain-containing protein [Bacteroidota bacterium]